MRRTTVLLSVAALLLVLVAACEKSDEVPGAGGAGTPEQPRPDELTLASAFRPILANGTDTLAIRATVIDQKGRGVGNIGVSFSTTHGTIQTNATTDEDGVATAVLTAASSQTDVVATVRANTEASKVGKQFEGQTVVLLTAVPLSSALKVRAAAARVYPLPNGEAITLASDLDDQASVLMRGVSLSLRAEPETIPADGISTARVIATLVETTRRVPIENGEVRFGSTAGTITGSTRTNQAGSAFATLAAHPGDTEALVTAYYGPELTEEVGVAFRALALSLIPAASALIADGTSSTTLTARLTVVGQGTPVAGARIDFSTSGGIVTSPATTDVTGAAVATLIASSTVEEVTVTARFGEVLEEMVEVAFIAPPPTASILLSADKTTLPADDASVAELTASALDSNGNRVPDGALVVFSIEEGDGQIVGPAARTVGGIARASYVAGATPGTVIVQAQSGTAVAVMPIVLTHLDVADIDLSAEEPAILADGVSMTRVMAIVRNRFGSPVRPGTIVAFETTLGHLEDVTPSDSEGIATARLRATPYVTGTGRVTAEAGGVQKSVDVAFVSEAAAHIEAVRVEHPRIGVRGASDHETATIHFEVQDRNGIPVDADHPVTLSFSLRPLGAGTDATVYPPAATTNEKGVVAATINAGIVSGVVELQATSEGLLSRPIRVAIHGDLPDPTHFSVFFEKVNIPGLVYAGLTNGVIAKVGDQWGNPVPDSTAVWFNAEYGIVQGSGFTDVLGDARVLEETAAPFPLIPGGDGLVRVCAQTVSKAGDLIQTCNYVMWSGHTIVEITEPSEGFNVPNGGSVTIAYRVRDANFNPLTEGTSITVTTTAGNLGGITEFVLPDTQNDEYTSFEAVLIDAEPEVIETTAVTVTVSVRSRNGNRTEFISGTLN